MGSSYFTHHVFAFNSLVDTGRNALPPVCPSLSPTSGVYKSKYHISYYCKPMFCQNQLYMYLIYPSASL